ncbi:hypothetical protein HK28_03965 [Acetobacter sp. DsW_063]|nr:hypothetical protein HK28_03965 [Acetobacter sp. DsW_063]
MLQRTNAAIQTARDWLSVRFSANHKRKNAAFFAKRNQRVPALPAKRLKVGHGSAVRREHPQPVSSAEATERPIGFQHG